MTVRIGSDRATNGPHGMAWDGEGSTVDVEDHGLARQLLDLPGFHEVIPDGGQAQVDAHHGRHEAPVAVTEPDPGAATPDTTAPPVEDKGADDKSKTTKAAAAKAAADETPKGARGKAVTE